MRIRSNDHFQPAKHVSSRAGFTLIELLVVVAIIAILSVILFPVFKEAKKSARAVAANSDLVQLRAAMQAVFLADGDYPLSITDERLLDELPPALAASVIASINQGQLEFKYFIISVRPGVEGQEETWDFRIAAGLFTNPLTSPHANSWTFDDARVIGPVGSTGPAKIFQDGLEISDSSEEQGFYWWPWIEDASSPPVVQADLTLARLTARGAELVRPMLESSPQLTAQIRAHMKKPQTLVDAQNNFDSDMLALFDDILPLTPEEADLLTEANWSTLPGDPAHLFSPAGVRELITFYSDDEAVTLSLHAKLDAVEAAEAAGNLSAKRGQIKLIQNQVKFQSGGAFTEAEARTIIAILKTL